MVQYRYQTGGAALRWYGALPRSSEVELPSRHLGLVQADELGVSDQLVADPSQEAVDVPEGVRRSPRDPAGALL